MLLQRVAMRKAGKKMGELCNDSLLALALTYEALCRQLIASSSRWQDKVSIRETQDPSGCHNIPIVVFLAHTGRCAEPTTASA